MCIQPIVRLVVLAVCKVLVVKLTQVVLEFQVQTVRKLESNKKAMLEQLLPWTEPSRNFIYFIPLVKGFFLV
jgi:hypothetical protein